MTSQSSKWLMKIAVRMDEKRHTQNSFPHSYSLELKHHFFAIAVFATYRTYFPTYLKLVMLPFDIISDPLPFLQLYCITGINKLHV